MKITICEPCKRLDNKTTETDSVMRVKGKSFLNMDICPEHSQQVRKMTMPDYVRFVYHVQGIELKENDAEIREKFLR